VNRMAARQGAQGSGTTGHGPMVTAMFFRLRESQLRQTGEDYSNRKRVRDAGFLVAVLARYGDGNPGRSADLVLTEQPAADRNLLCPDGLSQAPDGPGDPGVLVPARGRGRRRSRTADRRAPGRGFRLRLGGACACPQLSRDIQGPRSPRPTRDNAASQMILLGIFRTLPLPSP
jgi:hypothetical protein